MVDGQALALEHGELAGPDIRGGDVDAGGVGLAQPVEIDLPAQLAETVRSVASKIPDAELAENGRESHPHVTVKYGLEIDDAATVQKVVEGFGTIVLRLGATSIFAASESGKADVVKLDVFSPDLHRLNTAIADAVPLQETHPTYMPHVHLAYV